MLIPYQSIPFLHVFSFFQRPIITYGFVLTVNGLLLNRDYIVGFVNLVEDDVLSQQPSALSVTFLRLLGSLPFNIMHFFFIQNFCLDISISGSLLISFWQEGIRSASVIRRVLSLRRRYLLQYAQRRVCSRMHSWFMAQLWTVCAYNKYDMFRHNFFNLSYTYKHLIRSDVYKAGMLLKHPNFHLFVHIISNPYFWTTLQQTLNSYHRFK